MISQSTPALSSLNLSTNIPSFRKTGHPFAIAPIRNPFYLFMTRINLLTTFLDQAQKRRKETLIPPPPALPYQKSLGEQTYPLFKLRLNFSTQGLPFFQRNDTPSPPSRHHCLAGYHGSRFCVQHVITAPLAFCLFPYCCFCGRGAVSHVLGVMGCQRSGAGAGGGQVKYRFAFILFRSWLDS